MQTKHRVTIAGLVACFVLAAVGIFLLVTASSGDDAAFVSQKVPTEMYPGDQHEVSITMRNTGTDIWDAANRFRLGSQQPFDNLRWGLSRIDLDPGVRVPPQQTTTFRATITAPPVGTYPYQWRMVHEGVNWFGETTPLIQIEVHRPDRAEFVAQTVPAEMDAGGEYTVKVTMKNTGKTTWSWDLGFELGSEAPMDNERWGPYSARIYFGEDDEVGPGGEYQFSRDVQAPLRPGKYDMQWRMLNVAVGWFGEKSEKVTVNVVEGEITAIRRRERQIREEAALRAKAATPKSARSKIRAFNLATQARVFLRMGRREDALVVARESFALMQPGSTDGEATIRLTYAEALYANGDLRRAKSAISDARRYLLRRAAKLKDTGARERFLKRPEHARTLTLAKAWAP